MHVKKGTNFRDTTLGFLPPETQTEIEPDGIRKLTAAEPILPKC